MTRANVGSIDEQQKIKFFARLKAHYQSQSGEPFYLTKKEFEFLFYEGVIDYGNARLIDVDNNIYTRHL